MNLTYLPHTDAKPMALKTYWLQAHTLYGEQLESLLIHWFVICQGPLFPWYWLTGLGISKLYNFDTYESTHLKDEGTRHAPAIRCDLGVETCTSALSHHQKQQHSYGCVQYLLYLLRVACRPNQRPGGWKRDADVRSDRLVFSSGTWDFRARL